MKKAVTQRALTQRINRVLSKDGQTLKALRGDRGLNELGRYYIVDANANSIVAQHVNPEKLGRELGVLKGYEVVED